MNWCLYYNYYRDSEINNKAFVFHEEFAKKELLMGSDNCKA